MSNDIEVLRGTHAGKPCYLVGTGPSAKKARKTSFVAGVPVITLNLAILPIEHLGLDNPIYSMQKDGGDKTKCPNCADRCGSMTKTGATLLVHDHESRDCYIDYSPRYVFDAIKLFDGLNPFGYKEFSANCALKIAQLFGCTTITLIGFDACTSGDTRNCCGEQTVVLFSYLEQVPRMNELIKRDKLNVTYI